MHAEVDVMRPQRSMVTWAGGLDTSDDLTVREFNAGSAGHALSGRRKPAKGVGKKDVGSPNDVGPGQVESTRRSCCSSHRTWSHTSGWDGCPPGRSRSLARMGNPEQFISLLEKAVKGERGGAPPPVLHL